MKSLKLLPLFALALSCSVRSKDDSSAREVSLGRVLQNQVKTLSPQAKEVEVLVYSPNLRTMAGLQEQSAKLGGTVEIEHGSSIAKLRIAKENLNKIDVTENTLATLNSSVTVSRSQPVDSQRGISSEQSEELIQSLLANRKVVGVDDLVARFPNADGRNLKAAVIDTGIDFGIPGISAASSTERKVLGHFDLTGFGTVDVQPFAGSLSETRTIQAGNRSLSLSETLGTLTILGTGVLSEVELAKNRLAAEGVDLNWNSSANDEFPFVLARDVQGEKIVLIDVNRDGKIENLSLEAFKDFNSSGQFVTLANEGPSGAAPLAVTILNDQKVQFHAVINGHGTGCSAIIAGDGYAHGRLKGMAPKAKLLSYVIDAQGTDVYNMEQLIGMFLHARDQGADAISVSWGFSTADLESARFFANVLDREVTSKGVVVGIAAGNEGPGMTSAAADDYIPRNGFGLGALISKEQAKNVYQWSNVEKDDVIYYSSVGPTRGGRLIPDLVSPLMTLVREHRTPNAGNYQPFGGTSSATPAFVGATLALVSAIKDSGVAQIDTRLLKLALQNSAQGIDGTDVLRQGAGIVNVNRAYDKYLQLHKEMEAAKASPAKDKSFAYDINVQTTLAENGTDGEGVITSVTLGGEVAPQFVTIKLAPESASMVDPAEFFETFTLSHKNAFVQLDAQIITLQADAGSRFGVRFNLDQLSQVGTYTDVIELKRTSDGLVLKRIPVKVTVRSAAEVSRVYGAVSGELQPFGQMRIPFKVTKNESPLLQVHYANMKLAQNGILIAAIYDSKGIEIFGDRKVIAQSGSYALNLPTLSAGDYECVLYPAFRRPAVLAPLNVSISLSRPSVVVENVEVSAGVMNVALKSFADVGVQSVDVVLNAQTYATILQPDLNHRLPGFVGSLSLNRPVESANISLTESALGGSLSPAQHFATSIFNTESSLPLFWGWITPQSGNMDGLGIAFPAEASQLEIRAYPNIVSWEKYRGSMITAEVTIPLAEEIKASAKQRVAALAANRLSLVTFELPAQDLANVSGKIVIKTADGVLTLPLKL